MSRRPAPRQVLSDRDRALLRDLASFGFASGGQLARLHFTEGTTVGRQRRSQAALRRLTDDGYLHRLPRRIGGAGSGSERFVYQLGFRGQRAVHPSRRARTPDAAGWLFVEHSLAVAEVVVELTEAERRGDCRQLQIVTEPGVWRHFNGGVGSSGRAVVLKPDLGVRFEAGDVRRAWFVEVDRSTESFKRIRTKAGLYLDYWRSGLEQQRPDMQGAFPRVLWSVPDAARSKALKRTLDSRPDPAGAMFAVAVATGGETVRALLGHPINQARGPSKRGGET